MSAPDYRDFDFRASLRRLSAKAAHCQQSGPTRKSGSRRANRDQARKSFEIDSLHLPSRAAAIARIGRTDLHLLGPQQDAGVSFIGKIVDSNPPQSAISHAAGQLSGEQHRLA